MKVLLLLALATCAYGYSANQRSSILLHSETLHSETKAHGPLFTEKTMPPVSTTMQCIINLAAQYFICYTLLAVLRTWNQFFSNSQLGLEKIVLTGCSTVTFAPMLSVLFLGTRMRAIQLSGGKTEDPDHPLPQDYVKTCMQLCAWSLLVQVLVVFVLPLFTGETEVPADVYGNVDLDALNKKMSKSMVYCFSGVKYTAMAALYGGFVGIAVGIFTMEANPTVYPDGTPPVSPAVSATINLSIQFFIVYLLLALVTTTMQFQGVSPFLQKVQVCVQMAETTVNMAPMLCILFIGARMRALQIDPKNGNPQSWAQTCFYMCAYSVMIQALIVVILPLVKSEVKVRKGPVEGDVVFEGLDNVTGSIITIIRYVALFCLYGGFTAVIVSVFTIEHPTNVALTPAISPAMSCVMNLTIQYFFVQLFYFLAQTHAQYAGQGNILIQMMESAMKTVMFAPMLAVLFLGTRMRALQLSRTENGIPQGAGPQEFAQICMFLSTWAVLIQLVLVMITSVLYKIEMDKDGNVLPPKDSPVFVAAAINFVRYFSMIAMYGGSIIIIYAVFVMTPETVQPFGEDFEVLGVKPSVPAPPTPATPSYF